MQKIIKPNLDLRRLFAGGVLFMIVLLAGCIEKPQQKELILSNYPKLFEKYVIVVGENIRQIEREGGEIL